MQVTEPMVRYGILPQTFQLLRGPRTAVGKRWHVRRCLPHRLAPARRNTANAAAISRPFALIVSISSSGVRVFSFVCALGFTALRPSTLMSSVSPDKPRGSTFRALMQQERQAETARVNAAVEADPQVVAARGRLTSAEIAIAGLGPRYLEGYGEVTAAAGAALEGSVTELRELFGRVAVFLAQGVGRDLPARLTRLGARGLGVKVLRALGGVIGRYGLVEFRSSMGMLLERVESGAEVCGALERYARQVDDWRGTYLQRLREEFVAGVDVYRTRVRVGGGVEAGEMAGMREAVESPEGLYGQLAGSA